MPAVLGIVIPTLNEADTVAGVLQDVGRLACATDVVVADGGSRDGTARVATAAGARVVEAPRGRGPQLNAGARAARGEWLCFLHADVRMPPTARAALERALDDHAVDAAVWGFHIDASGFWPRVMEVGTRVRHRLGGLPYGDQGLLVRRHIFEAVGGYPEVPIMEDVAVVRALRRHARVRRLGAPLLVSPRRWEREGPYRTWARNVFLLGAYLLGVPPERLARWYRAERP